jgi:uncharacterized membrane protein
MPALLAAFAILSPVPILAILGVLAVWLRLRGLIADEHIAELSQPFSKSTLTVVGIAIIIGQLSWIAAKL